jgi:hypothetical protein
MLFVVMGQLLWLVRRIWRVSDMKHIITLIIVIFLTGLLSGCESRLDNAKGEQVCLEHDGLYDISYLASRYISFKCKDGTLIDIKSKQEYDTIVGDRVSSYLRGNN